MTLCPNVYVCYLVLMLRLKLAIFVKKITPLIPLGIGSAISLISVSKSLNRCAFVLLSTKHVLHF